jgi:hypothetical protein
METRKDQTDTSARPDSAPRNEAREVLLYLKDRVDSIQSSMQALSKMGTEDPLVRAEPMLPCLFNLHDAVFRHTLAIEAGEATPTAFAFDLLKLIEGELSAIGIDVVRPVAGQEPDLSVMRMSNVIETPWWRVPGQICRVETCGFATRAAGGRTKVLRKASVVVYRRREG